MDSKGSNILEGEALESDDEVNDYPGFVANTMVTETKTDGKNEGPSSSVVVSGEASESDDDVGDYLMGGNFPTLDMKVSREDDAQDDFSISIETKKPRFESPFHKKIWERNFAFRLGIVQMELEKYEEINKRLTTFIPISNRSQLFAQEALKHYRKISQLTKDLSDNLENLIQTTDLPDLNESIPLN